MEWVIWLISLIWIAWGSLAILYTAQTRETAGKIMAQAGRVPLGAVAAVVGILLIVASRSSLQTGFIATLGFLALVKGVVFLWNPKGIYRRLTQWYLEETSDQTLRFFGIIALILGTALFSWA
ncbi:MAG: hypothetical protein PVF97_10065 [Desulfobacterales bacterium]|jgi:uncharacterized protein YjeT (DUF2065 family)